MRCEGPVGTQAVPREGQWVGLVQTGQYKDQLGQTGGLAPRGVLLWQLEAPRSLIGCEQKRFFF